MCSIYVKNPVLCSLICQIGELRDSGRILPAVSTNYLEALKMSRIPQNTSDKALWAVRLFGEWRGDARKRQCLDGASNCNVYVNVPFVQMTTDVT